jgi:transcriptional regulator with XRE-family HTH domain
VAIGERLKESQKQISQGDVEKRTGLLRCYIPRVENGHSSASVDTLEKMARALEVLCTGFLRTKLEARNRTSLLPGRNRREHKTGKPRFAHS